MPTSESARGIEITNASRRWRSSVSVSDAADFTFLVDQRVFTLALADGALGHVRGRLLEGVLAVGLARRDELRREERALCANQAVSPVQDRGHAG
jgi:hypothetical protein